MNNNPVHSYSTHHVQPKLSSLSCIREPTRSGSRQSGIITITSFIALSYVGCHAQLVNNALTLTVQKPSNISAGVILCNIGRSSGGLITRTSQRYDNDGDDNTIFFSAIMSFQQLILSIRFTILLFVSQSHATNDMLYQPHGIYIFEFYIFSGLVLI